MIELIDRIALDKDVEYWEEHSDPRLPEYYDTRDIEDVIASQPVIRAIPLTWIYSWCKNNLYDEKMRYIGYGCDTIWDMMEAWEKRNETN